MRLYRQSAEDAHTFECSDDREVHGRMCSLSLIAGSMIMSEAKKECRMSVYRVRSRPLIRSPSIRTESITTQYALLRTYIPTTEMVVFVVFSRLI